MATHLIHGFNVSDGGTGSVGKFRRFFPWALLHNYGWVGLIGLRWRNDKVVRDLLPHIRKGDVLICHSNGCLIAWRLVKQGAPVSAVVCIQPALRRDTRWPDDVNVLCLYNHDDWIVNLGRMWGRFMSVANPFRNRHGWGAAGRYGFDQESVTNWRTDTGDFPAKVHSGVFKNSAFYHWGGKVYSWVERHSG